MTHRDSLLTCLIHKSATTASKWLTNRNKADSRGKVGRDTQRIYQPIQHSITPRPSLERTRKSSIGELRISVTIVTDEPGGHVQREANSNANCHVQNPILHNGLQGNDTTQKRI